MMRFLTSLIFVFVFCAMGVNAQSSAKDCDTGFKLVEHALGESCVPENPQRVVSLDMTITELLLIADVQPVAASQTVLDAYTRMHPELEETFADVMEDAEDTGFPPNLEAILNADPDLIIGPRDLFTENLYPQLNDIAPTVIFDPAPGDWRSRLIFAGEVLGLSDTVDRLLADYDARVDELSELLGDGAGDVEVSLVRTFPGQIGLLLPGTAGAALLSELGLARPESQSVDYQFVLDELDGRAELLISEEGLLLADGDVVFVFGDPSALVEMPLWNALPAVQDGSAHEVGYYWWGDSLLSAHDMLDDLFAYVVEAEPQNANPFDDGLVVQSATSACPSDTREVVHMRGTTCVPEDPQRIVVLDPFTFEALVALDAPIVATSQIYIDNLTANFPQFTPALENIVDTGIPINSEVLLSIEPDVILCRRTACDGEYDALSAIAPTVFFDNMGASDWRESARFFAEAIGYAEQMEQVEAEFDTRLDDLRDDLNSAFDTPQTVTTVRIRAGQIRLYFQDSFMGTLLMSAGFATPEAQSDIIAGAVERFGRPTLANISVEQLRLIEADYAFIFALDGLNPDAAQSYLDELQSNPLWQSLSVVQNEQLYIVDNYWFGAGYIAGHAVIDDLYTFVIGSESPSLNPYDR